jgi:hypothetical protein
MNIFFERWASSNDTQKVIFWNSLNNTQKGNFWSNIFGNSQRAELWDLLKDHQKADLWNLLKDPQRIALWEFLEKTQRVDVWKVSDFWNALKNLEKAELWDLLKDHQKADLWNTLEYPQRVVLWNLLKDSQKADLLEILSRNYSLADMVFAARKIIEEQLKKQRHSKYKNVDISLEITDLIKDFGVKKGEELGAKKAKVYPEFKHSTSYIMITCDIGGKIAEYDSKGYISKTSARGLVGHEIAHIILHPDDVMNGKRTSKLSDAKLEEKADFFAQIISDLRDLYILQQHKCINVGKLSNKEAEEVIAESYRKQMKENGIEQKDVEKILTSALDLNEKSKTFTMSSAIFAAKEVINIVYRGKDNHNISQLIPCTINNDIVHIDNMLPTEKIFGYKIAIPQGIEDTKTNSDNITKGIGALLLNYEAIRKEKLKPLIPVKKERFPNSWKRINEFGCCLSKAKTEHLKRFTNHIKSKQRIQKIIDIYQNI